MNNSIFKSILLFAMAIFTSTSLLASETPAPEGDGDIIINVDENGVVTNISIAECCDIEMDFDKKLEVTLGVLRSGYGTEARVYSTGNTTYYDFFKGHKVARLVVIEEEKTLMMIQRELQL